MGYICLYLHTRVCTCENTWVYKYLWTLLDTSITPIPSSLSPSFVSGTGWDRIDFSTLANDCWLFSGQLYPLAVDFNSVMSKGALMKKWKDEHWYCVLPVETEVFILKLGVIKNAWASAGIKLTLKKSACFIWGKETEGLDVGNEPPCWIFRWKTSYCLSSLVSVSCFQAGAS